MTTELLGLVALMTSLTAALIMHTGFVIKL